MSTAVPLRFPIDAHGERVSSLTLRRPKGKDIAACGNPRVYIRRAKALIMEVDAAAIHAYIVALAEIPPTSADQIDGADWEAVQDAVLSFFSPTGSPEESAAGNGTEEKQFQGETSKTIKMPFDTTT